MVCGGGSTTCISHIRYRLVIYRTESVCGGRSSTNTALDGPVRWLHYQYIDLEDSGLEARSPGSSEVHEEHFSRLHHTVYCVFLYVSCANNVSDVLFYKRLSHTFNTHIKASQCTHTVLSSGSSLTPYLPLEQ